MPITVSEARRVAAATFRSWGLDPGQAELACLLVSEVVTNAVLHASVTSSPGRDLDFDMEPLMMPAPVGASARQTSVSVQQTAAACGPPAPVRGGAAAAWHDASPDAAPASTQDLQITQMTQNAQACPKEFALRLRRGATSVWVEVFDPDLRLPRIRTAGETDEGGRGLYLVEQLATRWGSRPTPEGKAVWFEMPRSGGRL